MTQQGLFEEPKTNIPFNNSVLKSALQKAVRRSNPELAVKIAKSLIEKDAHDYARRIFVIIMEEVVLHPELDKMPSLIQRLQKKGQIPTEEERNWLLTLAWDAASSPHRDFFVRNPMIKPYDADQFNYMPEKEKGLVRAIIYRSKIGGMRFDTNMLEALSKIWVQRFTGGWSHESLYTSYSEARRRGKTVGGVIKPEERYVQWDEVEFVKGEDIPYYAIDFHCFPPIAKLILSNKKYPERARKLNSFINDKWPELSHDKEEAVKKTMWLMECSVNNKENIWYDPGRKVDWLIDGPDSHKEKESWRPIMEELNKMMTEDWKAVANWFIKKQQEAHSE